MFSLFRQKCRYCGNALKEKCHEEEGIKFCCPSCASAYKEQVKNLEKSYLKKSCCK